MIPRFLSLTLAAGLGILPSTIALAQTTPAPTSATAPSFNPPSAPPDPASQAIAAAIMLKSKDDVDGSLAKLSEAIQLDPKNPAAYVLRGSIYCEKKLWPQAEADFKAAMQIAPENKALKFNYYAVKFMEKQYDAARAGYLPLERDMEMGDFASFNVFLCDLVGGHQDEAAKELAVFNKAESGASYYFGNAAWDISQKKYTDARSWLESAANIYEARKFSYYAQSMQYVGYLPLPKPAGAAATPNP